jgi:formamidopyrimidine-DNA glycosylase
VTGSARCDSSINVLSVGCIWTHSWAGYPRQSSTSPAIRLIRISTTSPPPQRIRSKDTEIKRVLLDQSVISGIGNIYADEALWRAKVNGRKPASKLSRKEVMGLIDHAREVMKEALAQGGTSFDSLYVNVNGESGYFERSLDAYGREGEPCRRCGAPIKREAFMNRSSYRCPRCQRSPGSRTARAAHER